jgi:hypothetical protein
MAVSVARARWDAYYTRSKAGEAIHHPIPVRALTAATAGRRLILLHASRVVKVSSALCRLSVTLRMPTLPLSTAWSRAVGEVCIISDMGILRYMKFY